MYAQQDGESVRVCVYIRETVREKYACVCVCACVSLTGHSVGSILGQECFSRCLWSDTALIHPPPPWQRGQAGLPWRLHI